MLLLRAHVEHPAQMISSSAHATLPKQLKISSSQLAFPAPVCVLLRGRIFQRAMALRWVIRLDPRGGGGVVYRAKHEGKSWETVMPAQEAGPLLYGTWHLESSFLDRPHLVPHGRSQLFCPRM
jgi:hypothetical protein